LVDRIQEHCGHTRLRAHRLARGWSIRVMIGRLVEVASRGQRLEPSRVSHWELGDDQPSAEYRDALCRLYETGPVDLGFAQDYGAMPPRESATPLALINHGYAHWNSPTSAGADRSIGSLEQAGVLRRQADEILSGSTLSDATVDHKELVAEQYGRVYKALPVAAFFSNILADLAEVNSLIDRRLPQSQRGDLCAVIARLAGLISMTMVNCGRPREAREWVHTARLAADESGDPRLRAWVALRGAVASLHFGDPLATATAAGEAELLTRGRPSDVTAMAWAVLARALGIQADDAGARSALHRAEQLFDQVTSQTPSAQNSAYAFTNGQMMFYTANALTALGDTRQARVAQDAALATFGADERLDPALVRLDRALCSIQEDDVIGGVEYATHVLLTLPEDYRPPIIYRRGLAVAQAVPAERRAHPQVRALHDVLAIGPAELPA